MAFNRAITNAWDRQAPAPGPWGSFAPPGSNAPTADAPCREALLRRENLKRKPSGTDPPCKKQKAMTSPAKATINGILCGASSIPSLHASRVFPLLWKIRVSMVPIRTNSSAKKQTRARPTRRGTSSISTNPPLSAGHARAVVPTVLAAIKDALYPLPFRPRRSQPCVGGGPDDDRNPDAGTLHRGSQ